MNNNILNTVIQQFINNNIEADPVSLLLKRTSFENATLKEVVAQIEAKKKCKKKLPTWYSTANIYYPNKLNIEQTSSEVTARYKSEIISGNSLIDLSGGFGVDCFYFSKVFKSVTHCEINKELSNIAKHNFNVLEATNITTFNVDGLEHLVSSGIKYDCIYIDPSRRHDIKGKVFYLNDCIPNVPKHLDVLFKFSNNILIKTSPMLDINIGISELKYVKEIHIVAVNNEVKEVLFVLAYGFTGALAMKTINFQNDTVQKFNFDLEQEKNAIIKTSQVLDYLYEPNASILKSGGFKIISQKLGIDKLHKHSHLYTTATLKEFPGRSFRVKQQIPYNKKKVLPLIKGKKMNVTTRNFPESVAQLKKKFGFKDGGPEYVFFTTNASNEKVVLLCEKV